MSGHLSEGANWIEAVRKATEAERLRARALLLAYDAHDIIEMLDL